VTGSPYVSSPGLGLASMAALRAGLLAGGALGLLDLVQGRAAFAASGRTGLAALGVLLGAHAVAGLAAALLLALGACLRPPESARVRAGILLGLAGAALLLWSPIAQRLLAGSWISAQRGVGILRVAAPILLASGTALGALWALACLRRAWSGGSGLRLVLTAIGALSALGIDALDRRLLRAAAYEPAHDVLGATSLVLAAWACLALRRPGAASWRVHLATAGGILLACLLLILGARQAELRPILRAATARGGLLLAGVRCVYSPPRVGADQALVAEARAHLRLHRESAAEASQRFRSRHPEGVARHLLWITVDTLRADRLGCLGHSRPTTPALDRWARRGVLFAAAWAQNTITHFSFQSFFHGVYPPRTPLYHELRGRLGAPAPPTLAGHLRIHGFRTASFPAIPPASIDHPTYRVLTLDFEEVRPGLGPEDGIDLPTQLRAARAALASSRDRRNFVWVHAMEPHAPYEIHPGHDFGSSRADRYDSEVARVDELLGEFLDGLERDGLLEGTVVLVHSDHGESLGEHSMSYHGSNLYEEQVRVPILILAPGMPASICTVPVENVDLQPTVLDLLGVPEVPELDGESLVDLLEGEPTASRLPLARSDLPALVPELATRQGGLFALRLGRWKWIEAEDGEVELYDLASDPLELRNLAPEGGPEVARMRAWAVAMREDVARAGPAGSPLEEAPDWPARAALLQSGFEYLDAGSQACLLSWLRDPATPPGLRGALYRHLAPDSLAEVVELLRADLDRPPVSGVAAGALESLERAWVAGRRDVLHAARAELQGWLLGPAPMSRRAALLLAAIGDGMGRAILEEGQNSPDARVRLRSDAGLLLLGLDSGLERLARELPASCGDRELALVGLAALQARPDPRAYGAMASLLARTYLDASVRAAILDLLPGFEDHLFQDLAVRALAGWSAKAGDGLSDALRRRFGDDGPERVRAAARAFAEAMELQSLGLEAQASLAFERAAGIVPAAGILLEAARARLRAGGDPSGLVAQARASLPGSILEPRLRALEEPGGRLRVTGLRPLVPGPAATHAALRFVPGLVAGLLVVEVAGMESPVPEVGVQVPRLGLVPGERGLVCVELAGPAEPGWVRIRLRDHGNPGLDAESSLSAAIAVHGPDLAAAESAGDPSPGAWVHEWLARPGSWPFELEPGGLVWWIATDPAVAIHSPAFSAEQPAILAFELGISEPDLVPGPKILVETESEPGLATERPDASPGPSGGSGAALSMILDARPGDRWRFRVDPGLLPRAVLVRGFRFVPR
jgi:arylsulfatase A-like enzyme